MADPPRLTYSFPIRQFAGVDPANITLTFNALVNDINSALTALGANNAGFVTMKQLRRALVSQGQMVAMSGAIPGDVTNTNNIAWTSGGQIAVGDSLYNFIAATLGYTAAQMSTLFSLALTFPP